MTVEKGLIYQQIPKIIASAKAVGKSGTASANQGGYKFRKAEDLVATIKPLLAENKVFVVPNVIGKIREERQTKSGSIMIYSILTVEHRFYAEDGSFVTATTIGEGADTGDKGSNKAMTAAFKYAITETFFIPTSDLIDSESSDDVVEATISKRQDDIPDFKPPLTGDIGDTKIPIGSNKGKKFKDVSLEDIKSMAQWCSDKPNFKELYDKATAFLEGK